jgi:hypothetical protein
VSVDDDEIRFTLDHEVPFRPLAGDPIVVRVTSITVSRRVELTGDVDLTTWKRAFDAGCFHLDDEDPLPDEDPAAPVTTELRLRPRVAAMFADEMALTESLLTDDDSPLRCTEAWLATTAVQRSAVPGDPDAFIDIGIRTRWAAPMFPGTT